MAGASVVAPKSGVLTQAEKDAYDAITAQFSHQVEQYKLYLSSKPAGWLKTMKDRCAAMGFEIDTDVGRLSYSKKFQPLQLGFELCYVRHGKTEGNTEPRVFQGQVDYPENQLNAIGRQQAKEAAVKMEHAMEAKGWVPDLIVFSPLGRAIETGNAFAQRHVEIPTFILHESAEMAFGSWDNLRVIDIPGDSVAHLFYIEQNALVASDSPHCVTERTVGDRLKPGTKIPAECFIDVLERIQRALRSIEQHPVVAARARRSRPKVLMYGHSMAGAAISMLLGHGKKVEKGEGLGFDGKYIMPNATPTFLSAAPPHLT